MRRLHVAVFLAFLAAVLAPRPAPAGCPVVISGLVQSGGGPVRGALVTVTWKEQTRKRTAYTNATGTFKFEGMPCDQFRIQVEFQGYKPEVKWAEPHEDVHLVFFLKPIAPDGGHLDQER